LQIDRDLLARLPELGNSPKFSIQNALHSPFEIRLHVRMREIQGNVMKTSSQKSTKSGHDAASAKIETGGARPGRPAKKGARQGLPRAERQTLVIAKAAEYFAEHGLNAQTRAIAQACGVSQRLLYSLFPSKAALIDAVYEREMAELFDAMWFVKLRDRSVPLGKRLGWAGPRFARAWGMI
jgi:hypothetical protein